MFGIVVSALNAFLGTAIGLFLRTVVIKFLIFTAMFLISAAFVPILQSSGLLPTAAKIQSGLSAIPPSMGYLMSIFNIYWGIGVIVSAWTSRFIIRRLPKLNG
jgi:hypothetical protein